MFTRYHLVSPTPPKPLDFELNRKVRSFLKMCMKKDATVIIVISLQGEI